MKKLSKLLLLVATCFMCSITAKADTGLTEVMGGYSVETATPISFNEDYVSTKGENEDLYYKFTTPNKKAWYFLYVKNINIPARYSNSYDDSDFDAYIENAYGEYIKKTGYSANQPTEAVTMQTVLEPNTTYYIHADGKNGGNFRFYLYYHEDKVGDWKEEASRIFLNNKVNGTIDGLDDVDWYAFKTTNLKNYKLLFENVGGADCSVYVYNQYGETIVDNLLSIWPWIAFGEFEMNDLQPNTMYYIKVVSYNSDYYTNEYLVSVYPNRTAIQDATVTYTTTFKYTGKTIQPYVKVTYNGTTLSKGTDYTISYSNNKKPGKGKITIKGMNGYTGTITKYFDILPKKQTIKKVSNLSGRKMKVSYTKDNNVTGYEIQYSPYKNFLYDTQTVKVKGKNNTSKTIKNLTKNQTYYVRVRSYVKSGSNTVAGNWSSVKKVKIKK